MQFRYWFVLLAFVSASAFAQTSTTPSKKPKGDFVDVGGGEDEDTPAPAASATPEEKPAPKPQEEILTGTVNVMRKNGLTEVFFKDLKESYFIPSGATNSSIFRALEESRKTGKKVTFKANKKSRQVIQIEDGAAAGSGKEGSK